MDGKSNFVKGQLDSYRSMKKWIELTYPLKRFELEHKLEGHKPITYDSIVFGGGTCSNESLRRSKLIDKINGLEKHLRYAQRVVDFCEEQFEKVKPEYKDIIELRFKQGRDIQYIAKKTNYKENSLYKIIEKETERLSKM